MTDSACAHVHLQILVTQSATQPAERVIVLSLTRGETILGAVMDPDAARSAAAALLSQADALDVAALTAAAHPRPRDTA